MSLLRYALLTPILPHTSLPPHRERDTVSAGSAAVLLGCRCRAAHPAIEGEHLSSSSIAPSKLIAYLQPSLLITHLHVGRFSTISAYSQAALGASLRYPY